MIFYWIRNFLTALARLFSPVKEKDVARIDPNQSCPGCGAHSGKLRAIAVPISNAQKGETKMLIQHTCDVCGWREFCAPVVNAPPFTAAPAIPRNDFEMREDRYNQTYGISLSLKPSGKEQRN